VIVVVGVMWVYVVQVVVDGGFLKQFFQKQLLLELSQRLFLRWACLWVSHLSSVEQDCLRQKCLLLVQVLVVKRVRWG
jgi:hypothetical protein